MRNRLGIAVLVSGALLAWLAAPAAAQKVVKIGDLGSKVGVFEGYGKYQTMAIQMAVDELNAKGGVLGHKIEMIAEDDETKPAPAVRKAEKLILQDDVKLLIGAVSSGSTMAVMDVTKKHKIIHWNSVSCAEFMRTTKFHKYYFSNQPDSRMQAAGLAKYMVEKMGKKVYIFYTDYAMGQSDGRQFKTALEKLGGEVVGVAGAPLDTKDFSPWFGAINQSNPDVLFLAFAGTDSLRLMTQLHSFGMTKKYKLAGHRLLPAPAGSARDRGADGGLRAARPLLRLQPGHEHAGVQRQVQEEVRRGRQHHGRGLRRGAVLGRRGREGEELRFRQGGGGAGGHVRRQHPHRPPVHPEGRPPGRDGHAPLPGEGRQEPADRGGGRARTRSARRWSARTRSRTSRWDIKKK